MKTLVQEFNLNRKNISLVPEREENLVEKAGYFFPRQVNDKTLFVTGVSGTGKTTLVKEFCDKIGIFYKDDQALVIFEEDFSLSKGFSFPEYSLFEKFPFSHYFEFNSLYDLRNEKIIDGHFMFYSSMVHPVNPFFAHSYKFVNKNVNLTFDFDIPENIKNNFVFEFRQFSPEKISALKESRNNNQNKGYFHDGILHYRSNQTLLQTNKSLNLLWDVAYFLHNQGADVYIRDDLKGIPLRFKE